MIADWGLDIEVESVVIIVAAAGHAVGSLLVSHCGDGVDCSRAAAGGDVLKDEPEHRRGEAKGNAQRPRTLNTRVDAQNEPGPKVTGGTLPHGVGFNETVLYYRLSGFSDPLGHHARCSHAAGAPAPAAPAHYKR